MDFSIVKRADEPVTGKRGSNGDLRRPPEEPPDLSSFSKREPNRIGQFIQQVILGKQPGGRPVRLSVRHLRQGNIPGDKIGDQDISDLTEEMIPALAIGIYQAAENDAISLGGEQHYIVQVFLESEPNDPAARTIFIVNMDGSPQEREIAQRRFEAPMDSNPPNESGVIGQVMRQNQVLLTQNMGFVAAALGMVKAAQEHNEKLMKRLGEEEDRRMKNMEIVERAKGDEWARQKELKLLEDKAESTKMMWSMLKDVVAPAILRRVGASDPKQRIRADDEQEMNLALALVGDRYEKIMSILGEDQVAAFAFAEWMAFNIDRAQKVQNGEPLEDPPARRPQIPAAAVAATRQMQVAQAQQQLSAQPAGAGAAGAATQAQQQAAAVAQADQQPMTPAELRAAALKAAEQQKALWEQRITSIREAEEKASKAAAEAAQTAETAAPATPAAKPEGGERPAKKAKAAKNDTALMQQPAEEPKQE